MNAETRERLESVLKNIRDWDQTSHPQHITVAEATITGLLDAEPQPAPAAPEPACPYIVTSDEGTSYCRLAADGGAPARAEPESARPQGIPKPPRRVISPKDDLAAWVSQRITYSQAVEDKMPDADRRYLAARWKRDLQEIQTALAVAPPSPAVSLPDGWPWDAETRSKLSHLVYTAAGWWLVGGNDHKTLDAATSLARWLDQSPPTEGEQT